jgi:myo-inositol catabolism protein IolS
VCWLIVGPSAVDREHLPGYEVTRPTREELASSRDVIGCPSVLEGLKRLEMLKGGSTITAMLYLVLRSNGTGHDVSTRILLTPSDQASGLVKATLAPEPTKRRTIATIPFSSLPSLGQPVRPRKSRVTSQDAPNDCDTGPNNERRSPPGCIRQPSLHMWPHYSTFRKCHTFLYTRTKCMIYEILSCDREAQMGTENAELQLPQLGLGCWSFAGGQYWGEQTVDDSIATVHAALDYGIALFDTSENYVDDHHSEEVLGAALAGRRDEALIATKVAKGNLRRDDIIDACHASLERLGTDYIDLYQIHWPNSAIPIDESYGAMSDLLDSGLIRSFGVCNFGPIDLADLLRVQRPVSNQMAYNLLWRGVESDVVPILEEEEIGLMCYSPLAQGLLAGRYLSPEEVKGGVASSRIFSSSRETAGHDDPGFEDEAFAAVELVLDVARELGIPPALLSVKWLLSRPAVRTVLVGARRPEEIATAADAIASGGADLADALSTLTSGTAPLKTMLAGNLDMWTTEGRIR